MSDYVVKMVPLADLWPSPTNPRKHFDADQLSELAASIRAQGLLQPLLVRPFAGRLEPHGTLNLFYLVNADSGRRVGSVELHSLSRAEAALERGGLHEVVAGERRFRAAALAGLTEVPCVVRPMTDQEVSEAQLVENDQRVDVRPSERSAAYAAYLAAGGTLEGLATKVGRSVSAVRATLLLARMPKDLAEAVDEGRVPRSTAELVCRLPSAEMREEAALCVVHNYAHPDDMRADRLDGDLRTETGDYEVDGPLSYRDAKQLIERHFTRELKGAPFRPGDAKLLPGAGSCKDCPKRVGNLQKEDPEGWAGARADVCTDPACYRSKCEAQAARAEAAAQRKGLPVLDAGEREKALPGGHLSTGRGWVDLEARCWAPEADGKTYRELLGADLEGNVVQEYLAHDDAFRPRHLAKEGQVTKALNAKGLPGVRGERPKVEPPRVERTSGPLPADEQGEAPGAAPAPPGPPAWKVQKRAREIALAEVIGRARSGLAATDSLRLAAWVTALEDLDAVGWSDRPPLGEFVPGLLEEGADRPALVAEWARSTAPSELVAYLAASAADRVVDRRDAETAGAREHLQRVFLPEGGLVGCEAKARAELAPPPDDEKPKGKKRKAGA